MFSSALIWKILVLAVLGVWGFAMLLGLFIAKARRRRHKKRALEVLSQSGGTVTAEQFAYALKWAFESSKKPDPRFAQIVLRHELRGEDAATLLEIVLDKQTLNADNRDCASYLAGLYADNGKSIPASRILDALIVAGLASQDDVARRTRIVLEQAETAPYAIAVCEQNLSTASDEALREKTAAYLADYYCLVWESGQFSASEKRNLAERGLAVLEKTPAPISSTSPNHCIALIRCLHILGRFDECCARCRETFTIYGEPILDTIAIMWANAMVNLYKASGFTTASLEATASRCKNSEPVLLRVFSRAWELSQNTLFLGPLASIQARLAKTDENAMRAYIEAIKRDCAEPDVLKLVFNHCYSRGQWKNGRYVGMALLKAHRPAGNFTIQLTECLVHLDDGLADQTSFDVARGVYDAFQADPAYLTMMCRALLNRPIWDADLAKLAVKLEESHANGQPSQELRVRILALQPLIPVFRRWWDSGGRDPDLVEKMVFLMAHGGENDKRICEAGKWLLDNGRTSPLLCAVLANYYLANALPKENAQALAQALEKLWQGASDFSDADANAFSAVRRAGAKFNAGSYAACIGHAHRNDDKSRIRQLMGEYLEAAYYDEKLLKEMALSGRNLDRETEARALRKLIEKGHHVVEAGLRLLDFLASLPGAAHERAAVKRAMIDAFTNSQTTDEHRQAVWRHVADDLIQKAPESWTPTECVVLLFAFERDLLSPGDPTYAKVSEALCERFLQLKKRGQRPVASICKTLARHRLLKPGLARKALLFFAGGEEDPATLYTLAAVASKEHPEMPVVRQTLVNSLLTFPEWNADECDHAVRLLEAKPDKLLEQAMVERVHAGGKPQWDRCLETIMKKQPRLAEGNYDRLTTLAAALKADQKPLQAAETMEKALPLAPNTEEQTQCLLAILDLAGVVDGYTVVHGFFTRLKPLCVANPETAAALKDLGLKKGLPAVEVIEVLSQLERHEFERSTPRAAQRFLEDRRGVLEAYLRQGNIEETQIVLRHCSRVENLPSGLETDKAVDAVIGFFEQALKIFGSNSDLYRQFGDFCFVQMRFPEALTQYANFVQAGGQTEEAVERLRRLIGAVDPQIGLGTYLQAYHDLAALVRKNDPEEAEEILVAVRDYFLAHTDSSSTRNLAHADAANWHEEVRALRILYMNVLDDLRRARPRDVNTLEWLGAAAHSVHHWELASQAYYELVTLYADRPDGPGQLRRLYDRFFWCYYCRGPAHYEQIVTVIEAFVRDNQFTDGLDLTQLKEYCALAFHEFGLDADRVPPRQAKTYLRKAAKYYDDVLANPRAALERPYLLELRRFLDAGDAGIKPFDYLAVNYQGRLPYEIPTDKVFFGPLGSDPSIESMTLLPVDSGFGVIRRVRRRVGSEIQERAIKMLRRDLAVEDKADAERDFQGETEILKGLDHPNIVKFYAAGSADGKHYIEMEYVDGPDLERFINRRGTSTPLASKLDIFLKICLGVRYLHSCGAGIVHRDLHPRNVLLGGPDQGIVKVTDFGLARVLDEEGVHNSSRCCGRIQYVPPEVQSGRGAYTLQSDIYSLGRILCFMLTQYPDTLGWVEDRAGKALAGICSRATALDPLDRYDSVSDLIYAVEAVAASLPEPLDIPAYEKTVGGPAPLPEWPLVPVDKKTSGHDTTLTPLERLRQRFDVEQGERFPSMHELGRLDVKVNVVEKSSGKPYSLKFFSSSPQAGRSYLNRLDRLDALRAFTHPNVERVFESDEIVKKAIHYVLCSRSPSLSLKSILDCAVKHEDSTGDVAIPLSFVLQAGIQVADALAEVHGRDVVHRCISPLKILVDAQAGQCVLSDFSAAVLKDLEALGNSARILGDEMYLAPEIFRPGARITPGADLYSLGLCLSAALSTTYVNPRVGGSADVDTICGRHEVTEYAADRLVAFLADITQPEPEERKFTDARSFLRELIEIAEMAGVDAKKTDWSAVCRVCSQ